MRKVILHFIFIICFAISSYAGDLINCPDCGKKVSERAVMCPQCGCSASGIAEAVELKHAAEKLLVPRSVVRVKADDVSGYAVIVAEDNKSYVMMDASLMDATVSLSITLLATNKPIRFQNFEVSDNQSFIRFLVRSSEVAPVALIKEITPEIEGDSMWLTPDIYSDCIYTGKVSMSDKMEVSCVDNNVELVAFVDSKTNLAAIVCNDGAKKVSVSVVGELEWRKVSPLVYRNQTRLLVAAEKAARIGALPKDMTEKLTAEKWATEILKKRVKQLLSVKR